MMMAAETSYARLGVFVVVSVMLMLATGLFFIQRVKSREVMTFVTYFTEDVSGLDISSPVRFRGVAVGRVSNVRIDPTANTIEVDFELFKDRLSTVGANLKRIEEAAHLAMVPHTRARVVANPVTGEAYLLLDNPSNAPPPMALGFTPSRAYVPSMPSSLETVQNRVPAILEHAEKTLRTLTEIIARVPDNLDRSDRFFTRVERLLRESQLPKMTADLRTLSASTTAQMAQITSDMDRLAAVDVSLMKFTEEARSAIHEADFPASGRAARDAADRTSLAADDLRRSLPAMLETLAQLRELTRRLDAQPESVIYGPRPPEAKSR